MRTAALFLLALPSVLAAQSIADVTEGLEKRDGYFPLYWNAAEGRLLLEVPRFEEDFLYLTSLATGIGSLQLGLDRGMIAEEGIARFERVGQKVHLVLTNPAFMAGTENPALTRSVTESFPTSIVAAFDVAGETDGRVVVDATTFLVSDVIDLAGRLRRADQGSFRFDRERSSVHLPRTRAFPRNTEVEVVTTFTSDNPGFEIRRHAPDGRALTVRQHHSFVRLPDPGFRPRRFDTRAGLFAVTRWDFARPFSEDYPVRYAMRHRLRKRDPGAAVSEPVEPIVYYLDPAIQEPYRTAFRDGAMWWNAIFEAAGFRNAFRVEDMPPDMDPMDARYHVIQWVHRTEPGFSIGPSFVDPRTGEILKAAVRMDSYRSVPDYDIWAGTVPAFGMGPEAADAWLATLDPDVSAEAFVMARRRQHSAHEVGHTLGLAHNFVAASYGRASVMDYPAPLVRLENGRLTLTDAYREGGGAWDTLAIRYGYTVFASPEEEAAGLEALVNDAMRRGLKFITNPDEQATSSYPEATTWVNGANMVDELRRVASVRRFLIDRFDETAIQPGEPMVMLAQRFSTVYLHHRYTLDAAIKAIGGLEFRYAVRGDPLPPTAPVPAARQRQALDLLLDALAPEELAVPERVLALMAPRPFGHPWPGRGFRGDAGPAFDQLGLARALARDVVGGILHRERMARVAVLSARDPAFPGLDEVLGRVVERTWGIEPRGNGAPLQRAVQRVVADELMALAGDDRATVEARAAAEWALRLIGQTAGERQPLAAADAAHLALAQADIERFLNRPAPTAERSAPGALPPGSPIGNR